MICRACSAAASAPAVSPIASSESVGFIEGRGLAVLEVRRHLPGFGELILQRARPVENVFDEIGGDSDRVAEPLRQVEDETVGGLRRGRERVFGALALLVCDLPLLDGNAALPIGEPGEHERDEQPGGETARENVAPPGCAAPALGDERLGLLGWRGHVGRARGDPALGLLQRRRAQQQPARAAGGRPVARGFAELGVLPDPADVGSAAPRQADRRSPRKRVGSSKKMKFSRRSASGVAPSSTRRQTIGAKRLLSEAAYATSLSATSEATASGESTNTTVSARQISASMRFHQSSKA